MEKQEFKNRLQKKVKQFEISLEEIQLEQFYNYMLLLLEWNEKINLTAIVEPEEIIEKHFIDSISISQYIKSNDSILDIGTGAGFPGIPLKIIMPNTKITLLDSLNKRILFLNTTIDKLKLCNIKAFHGRAEEFNRQINIRESFDTVTSRAVAKLNVLLEYMLPFVKIGGTCICMKSSEIQEELQEAEKAIKLLGGEIRSIEEIILEGTNIKRKIVIIEKIKQTPKQYPRKAGMPSKEPIC